MDLRRAHRIFYAQITRIVADSDNIYHEGIEVIEVGRGVKDSIMFAAVDGKTVVNVFVSSMKAVEGHEVGSRGIR